MACDLCGREIDHFSHSCECGHGICQSCEDELKSQSYIIPQCFWWSCNFYGSVEIKRPWEVRLDEHREWEGIELTAQRFGALCGWTTELAEDSIISTPQLMFNEMDNRLAEEEELHRSEDNSGLNLEAIDEMINSIEDQGYRETNIQVPPNVAARMRQTPEFEDLRLMRVDSPIIGDRRRVEFSPRRFDMDVDEIRVTERIQFAPNTNNPIANIADIIE